MFHDRPTSLRVPDLVAPNDRPAPILFMHVPKTPGTAIIDALRASLAPRIAVDGFDRSLFGSFDGFDRFPAQERERLHLEAAAMPEDADLVAGHFALSTLRHRYPRGRLMTIMREPTSRLLSQWLYWRQAADEALASLPGWGDRVRLARRPLAAFLSEGVVAAQTDNACLRALLWPHPLIPADGFIAPQHDADLLRLAERRLAGFDLVELVENDKLGQVLADWLQRPFELRRTNETSAMPFERRVVLENELTPAALDRLNACTRLDEMLWNRVAGRRIPGVAPGMLRRQALAGSIARYVRMMSDGPVATSAERCLRTLHPAGDRNRLANAV